MEADELKSTYFRSQVVCAVKQLPFLLAFVYALCSVQILYSQTEGINEFEQLKRRIDELEKAQTFATEIDSKKSA